VALETKADFMALPEGTNGAELLRVIAPIV